MTAAAPVTAFLDASVLYPAMLRSVLLRLALADLYRPLWSDAVHEEWMPPSCATVRTLIGLGFRTRDLMKAHLDQAMVTGYAPLIEQLTLPDADDRHVLAAAIHGGASAIITVNRKDFPASALGPLGLEARHPMPSYAILSRETPMRPLRHCVMTGSVSKGPPRRFPPTSQTSLPQASPEPVAAFFSHSLKSYKARGHRRPSASTKVPASVKTTEIVACHSGVQGA